MASSQPAKNRRKTPVELSPAPAVEQAQRTGSIVDGLIMPDAKQQAGVDGADRSADARILKDLLASLGEEIRAATPAYEARKAKRHSSPVGVGGSKRIEVHWPAVFEMLRCRLEQETRPQECDAVIRGVLAGWTVAAVAGVVNEEHIVRSLAVLEGQRNSHATKRAGVALVSADRRDEIAAEDVALRKRRPKLSARGRAQAIGQKLGMKTETVRDYLKGGPRR